MRLFAAIRPPTAVLLHLAGAAAGVRDALPPGAGPPALRWTPVDQQHVTLAFYGEVPDGAATGLAAGLADVAAAAAPLTLQLAGAGSFTRRTLWAGVRTGGGTDPASLVTLMAATEALGGDLGRREPRDRRRAHLTLARVSGRSHQGVDLGAVVRALSVYVGPEWAVSHVELVASTLGRGRSGGPLHEVLERVPLGPCGTMDP